MACSGSLLVAVCDSSRPTSSGVITMPISVEPEALQIAAGILPRATAVSVTADCTVAGRVHRNSTPMYRSGVSKGSSTGRKAQPTTGKTTKVMAVTSRCSRQWLMPAQIAGRESLAPCRKNRKKITPTVISSRGRTKLPWTGRTLASNTVPISIKVKLSGRNRGRAMPCFQEGGANRGVCVQNVIGGHLHSKVKCIYLINL
ncbi:hypothetical protein D3C78_1231510 [compost metagenome]